MSWIGKPPTRGIAEAPLPAEPLKSLEYLSRVRAKGIAPGQAVIEQLSAAECRFRTVIFFVPNDIVELEFGGDSGVRVRGRIVSRVSIGPRFSYGISLSVMSIAETDTLARALAAAYRREAMSRSLDRLRTSIPTTDREMRKSHRVLSQFPLLYRSGTGGFKSASAGNISSTGLLMIANPRIALETRLELRFTLPSGVLAIYPEETATLDTRRGTIVRGPHPDPRRSFEEMNAIARVASSVESIRGSFVCGLEFQQIDGYTREEIARYVHARQLSLRR